MESPEREKYAPLHFLSGGGEMGERIRSFDWASTPLGPMQSWSPALRMMTGFMLANRFPLLLWWGPKFIQIYNDAYRPVLGAKHPSPGLGRPVSECWSEIWNILQPLIETPFHGGPATWMEDIYLEINRNGFMEETHFTIAYSPVPDETLPSGIGGVLATVHEITEKVVSERRVSLLRDLGAKAFEAKSAEEVCEIAGATLANTRDVPFALFYLLDSEKRTARLAATSGIGIGADGITTVIDLQSQYVPSVWPLAKVLKSEQIELVEDLPGKFRSIPKGPGSEPPQRAAVVPIRSSVPRQLAGFLVVGISSRLRFEEQYRSFLELMSTQIANAISNARAYEEERMRAVKLVELDRAKTAFFSNVSHELRTPLTLMLGPLEDLKEQFGHSSSSLDLRQYQQLDLAHRNGLRLLKLVNTLLDFSRIEAGRVQAVYEETDLAALTAELASVFRSAIEKAGLKLTVDCPPLPEPVFVDREMWEKIVLNLLSNAFKFTFEGEIELALRPSGKLVELSIRDTGTGIPRDQLDKIFQRFHRVPGSLGRTHEGTGIGLALVQELARLHGGSVSADSVYGRESTFRVFIPRGKSHLPRKHIGATRSQTSTALGASPFVEEAASWLRNEAVASGPSSPEIGRLPPGNATDGPKTRILLADDNADMRGYLKRLLSSQGYEVESVADGQAALNRAKANPPDLVLTDVMMPRLDGFALLKELRADERTRALPIIMLSARAGEEARVDGLDAGAHEYLIKPFSARELLACVRSQLELARLRHRVGGHFAAAG